MTDTDRELEFKLRATAALAPDAIESALRAATVGMAVAPAATAHHVDVYLDDAERSLQRQGIGLRLRSDSGRGTDPAIVCCKQRGRSSGGLHDRREREAPWSATAPPSLAAELPLPIRDAVEPWVRRRPLHPIVQLEVQRERRQLSLAGQALAEFAIDRVTASGRGQKTTFCEIELEVAPGGDLAACRQIAALLQAYLPIGPADDDKLTHSLAQLAMTPTAAPAPAPTTLGDWLTARLQHLLRALAAAESAVRLDGTVDDVHQLRVALRHTRALVSAFRAAWPADQVALAELALAAAARNLAELRACDALGARLGDLLDELPKSLLGAQAALAEQMAGERAELLNRARGYLRTESHADGCTHLERLADPAAMVPPASDGPWTAARLRLRQMARSARRRIRELASQPSLDDLHELRLSLKRLRVLAEQVGTADPRLRGQRRRRLLTALHRLGEACDRHAAADSFLAALDRDPADVELTALRAALATHQWLSAPKAERAALRAVRRLDRRRFWRWFVLQGIEPD